MSDVPVTRRKALDRVTEWWEALQVALPKGEHPLASVHSLHLVDAGGPDRVYGKETRRSGKSRPLIGDLPRSVREVDGIMRDINDLNRNAARALTIMAEGKGIVTQVADVMQISRPTAFRYVDVGIGMVQIALLRGNHF